MPINKGECYWVECDKCGAPPDVGDISIPHFEARDEAVQDAEDADWVFHKERGWCDRCAPYCVCGGSFTMHETLGVGIGGTPGYCDHEEGCECQEFNPDEATIGSTNAG